MSSVGSAGLKELHGHFRFLAAGFVRAATKINRDCVLYYPLLHRGTHYLRLILLMGVVVAHPIVRRICDQ